MPSNTFNIADPYSTEALEIQRRRQLAETLASQNSSLDGPTEMAGGWAVKKSPYAGLADILRKYTAGAERKKADADLKELGEKYRGDRSADMTMLAQMLKGTPASSEQIVDEQAAGGEGAPATITAPGRAGGVDPAMLAQLRTPQMQDMGMGMWAQQMAKENAPPELKDMGDRFAQIKNGQIVGYLPKGATPDATMKDATTRAKNEIAPSGVAFNPFQTKPGEVFNDPNKLMSIGQDGQQVLNQPLFNAKQKIAAKGATNVQVKTDVKTGESLAAQVGPMMKDSTAIAEGAVKQVDAAKRITQAVDSSKILTGPGAEARLTVDQIAQTLGIGGKDNAERIANTRQVMRGLAELTLQGRQQMKGQGAITESEGKLAEKAMSAEISLTAAEIKQLAKASERAARFNHNEHKRKLDVMQKNPNLQGIAPFYQGPAMPPEAGASTQVSSQTREFLRQQGIEID